FETSSGAATIVDFMPLRGRNSDIVRLVCGDRGAVQMTTELVLRFDYGRTVPWVTRLSPTTLRAISGPDMVLLHTPVPLRGVDLKTVGEFTVEAGRCVPFVLTHGPSHRPPPDAIDAARSLSETERFWRDWSRRREPDGEWD